MPGFPLCPCVSFALVIHAHLPSFSLCFSTNHRTMLLQVATSVYLDYYYNQRGKIFVPPSIKDNLLNTPYQTANLRQRLLSAGIRYDNEPNIAELTAYYCKWGLCV